MMAAEPRVSTLGSRFMKKLLLVLVIAGVTSCGEPELGPEAALRAWVAAMEQAAEEQDRREMLSHVSESYLDARDNDRDDVENMLRLYMLRHDNVGFVSTIDEIDVVGGTAAKINLTVAMAGTNDGTFGFDANAYRFELELEKPDDDWLLIGARWAPLGQDLR